MICYDPDRLSRDLGHLMLLVDELERNRTELIFVNAPHENTPEGMMLLQMRGMFAQYERAKIHERSRRGKERRAREGRVLTSWAAAYGYTYVKGQGRIEVNPVEARWTVKIFEWYVLDCLAMIAIARRLNDLGVPTKRGGIAWQPSTVASILKNSAYKGSWYYNKTNSTATQRRRNADGRNPKREKSPQRPRPQEEWIEVSVPAIVSSDLFDAVAPRMKQNAGNAKRNCQHNYLLRGMLLCKDCKRRLTARRLEVKGVPYYRYYCTGNEDQALKLTCTCPWPNAVTLDERVWGRIVRLFSDEELIQEQLEAHADLRQSERRREDADLTALIGSEQSLKAEESRFLDAYGKGVIDLDQLQEHMAIIRKQKEALAHTRAELEAQIAERDAVKARQASIEYLVARAKSGLHLFDFEDRRAFLEAIKFKGIVDAEADTIWIDGLIIIPPMSLSGKREPGTKDDTEEGTPDERLQLHTGYRDPVQREGSQEQAKVISQGWPRRDHPYFDRHAQVTG